MIVRKKFETFQYKDDEEPEQYDLQRIDSGKVVLIYGDKEEMCNSIDLNQLVDELQSNGKKLLANYFVPCKNWIHSDFIKGKDAGRCYIDMLLMLLNNRMYE